MCLAGWAEKGGSLRLNNASNFTIAAAARTGFARPVINAVMVLIAAFLIERVAVGAIAKR